MNARQRLDLTVWEDLSARALEAQGRGDLARMAHLAGLARRARNRFLFGAAYLLPPAPPRHRDTLTPVRSHIDTAVTGDYGADPLGDGTFRMVPSGDIVSFEERCRRLNRR